MSRKTATELDAQNKLRAMSLESFSKMVDGNDLRSGIINTAFSRAQSPLLIRRLEGFNGKFNLETEKGFQDRYVGQFASKLSEQNQTLKASQQKEQVAQEELNQAEADYQQAKVRLDNARARLNSAKKATNHAQDAVADCEAIHQRELERRQRMDKIVLVHVSATLVQLEKYGEYKMVVSYVDEPMMKILGIVDEVFDEERSKLVDIDSDYPEMYGSTTQLELRSRLAYVRMVAWYMLNDIPYELAYADKMIDELMRYNGII